MNFKLIAFYLPQFHEIDINDRAWGNGFTEWVNVKKARPLFPGHRQPRVPFKRNYYNLLQVDVLKWQIKLAEAAGLYGFCFFHYWFEGQLVLEKPVELFRSCTKGNIHYCFAWANESWTKTWHGASGEKEVLIPQTYGGREDWVAHFEYFLPYFQDERYMKENNCPMIVIYHIERIMDYVGMLKCWNELAVINGFDGIYVVYMKMDRGRLIKGNGISASLDYEPRRTRNENLLLEKGCFTEKYMSYSKIASAMLKRKNQKNQFRGIFVDYDDTPRRKKRGTVTFGSTPVHFGKLLKKSIKRSISEGNQYLFINAWNEWGEGNYLEPDAKYHYRYLKQIKKVMSQLGEKQ